LITIIIDAVFASLEPEQVDRNVAALKTDLRGLGDTIKNLIVVSAQGGADIPSVVCQQRDWHQEREALVEEIAAPSGAESDPRRRAEVERKVSAGDAGSESRFRRTHDPDDSRACGRAGVALWPGRASWCQMSSMMSGARSVALVVLAAVSAGCDSTARMSFFVTSTPAGDGGHIGGLAGADAHCQRLAAAVRSTKHWHAYLSTAAEDGHAAVDARDRIGTGPWFNAQGIQVAANLDDLHGPGNKLGGRTSLDERGHFVLANVHDILTGSNPDGTSAAGDATCRNWKSTDGHAMVGHSNKVGSIGGDRAGSWNSAHLSEGCSIAELQKLGSGGLLYCFAVD